jgi:hypothetical protein
MRTLDKGRVRHSRQREDREYRTCVLVIEPEPGVDIIISSHCDEAT